MFLRKLSDDERPLELRLYAGPNEKALSLVLKENETGEVNVSIEHALGIHSQTNMAISHCAAYTNAQSPSSLCPVGCLLYARAQELCPHVTA